MPLINAPPVPVTQVGQVRLPVTAFSTIGVDAPTAKVPLVLGSVNVGLPAAVCGVTNTVPLPLPAKEIVPVDVPGMPNTGLLEDVPTAGLVPVLASTDPPLSTMDPGVSVWKPGKPWLPPLLPQ